MAKKLVNNTKTILKNKFAQKLLNKGSMELNGITVHFWTGHNKENIATRYNWNKVKSCSFYNQHSTGDNGHIVVTGIMQIPRHEILEYAAKLGLKVHSRVTLETDLVVLGSENISPNKIADALKLIKKGHHVEFLDEVAFLEIVLENLEINDVDHSELDNNKNTKAITEKKKPNKKRKEKKQNSVIEQISNKLNGQTFVISGTFEKYSRDEYKTIIENNGGKNLSTVSPNMSFLLAGDKAGNVKIKKALALNKEIITEDEFLSRYKNIFQIDLK